MIVARSRRNICIAAALACGLCLVAQRSGAAGPGDSANTGVPMQNMKEVEGEYATTFEEVSNNCKTTGINLSKATIGVDRVRGR